ncbi:hypothetical protein [Streptomyces atriruber]|uniref:hypothetical protein n=1 Tax=Streptomyces atriruber TaxID=545121 RepID=UPI0006E272A4|nr:hypothetical protein [Streptomyces atriruber]
MSGIERYEAGPSGAVDAPRAPAGARAWDSRSEELLADAALVPGVPGVPGVPDVGDVPDVAGVPGLCGLPGTDVAPLGDGVSVPAFGEAASVPAFGEGGRGDEDGDSGWDARGRGRRGGGARSPLARAAARARPPRRGAADPVKALMHRHRELCERAVDPLEIAAGLEAHGVTDRAAARFRHRDVFALAEEMYARVPALPGGRVPSTAACPAASRPRRTPSGWALFALLPGAVCAVAVAGLALSEGRLRLAAALVGALAVAVALRVALRYGPLRAVAYPMPATRAWVCWLLAYALLGDGLLSGAVAGGPDGPGDLWDPAVAPLLALALAVAPATWCARLFAVRSGGRLAASRGLDEFASSVRPLLFGTVALFLGALGSLLAGVQALLRDEGAGPDHGAPAMVGAVALGALLLLARLLGVYGFTRAPALLLGAAGSCEAAALALVFAARLPGCDALATPVTAAVDAWGPGVVPATACGGAALVLLVHAARTLTLASAHAGSRDAP